MFRNMPQGRSVTPGYTVIYPNREKPASKLVKLVVCIILFASVTGGTTSSGGDGLAVPNAIVRRQLAIARSRGRTVSTGQCAG